MTMLAANAVRSALRAVPIVTSWALQALGCPVKARSEGKTTGETSRPQRGLWGHCRGLAAADVRKLRNVVALTLAASIRRRTTAKVAVVAGATAVRVSGALADVVLAANYLHMRQGYGTGVVNVNADGGTAWVVLRRPALARVHARTPA
jgi:hypothetical protein